jgi:membrane-bound lytic murein transglycosylase F
LIRAIVVAAMLLFAWTEASAQRAPKGATTEYDDLFKKYAKRYFGPAYDWRVFKAQAMAESNLTLDARSHVGARGLMQLMPTTFKEIQTKNPELACIDQPEWNIAAGIHYDRTLWRLWTEHPTPEDRRSFMLGSYNAGRGTLLRAQSAARKKSLDGCIWRSIAEVAPSVRGWRYRETLQYVEKIEANIDSLKGAEPRP